jgi:gliding motility-associated protein GldM
MSLPKEPRQKMINMMYLVLTALLALNVSSEILNAFKTIDRSLNVASGEADKKNQSLYKSFEEKMKDQQFAEKASVWKPKAEAAKTLSASLATYIDGLKADLKKEAGLELKDGKEAFKEDDLDAATRMFIKGGKGDELKNKMLEFKQKMLAIDPAIASACANIPINLEVPPSQTGEVNQDWSYSNFHMTPTIAAITILSKLQNDIKNSEAQVVDYCHSQIGQVVFKFDKFQAFIGSNSQYVLPGQEIKITGGIGAFSSAAQPTVTINGRQVALNDKGVAELSETASGSGTKQYKVRVDFKTPDGKQDFREETIDVTVGTPSGAAASADKMNVLYLGVDNPMTISTGSIKKESAKISFNGGALQNVGGDKYIARPSAEPGKYAITVSGDGKTNSFEFRVKRLPNPTAYVGSYKSGAVPSSAIKLMGGVRAALEDSEFDAPFSVIGYTITFTGRPFGGDLSTKVISGPAWDAAKAELNKCTPGCAVFVDNIKVKGPDGKERVLPNGLTFRLN